MKAAWLDETALSKIQLFLRPQKLFPKIYISPVMYTIGYEIRRRRMPISEDQLAHTATQCGQLLRDRRKRLGISMAAAAEAAGMSRVTWHRIETGEASVSWRYVLASAQVLDLDVQLSDTGFPVPRPVTAVADAMLPVSVRLDDYPQLRRLAWQVGDRMQAITPREALGLYERNLRHLEPDTLEPAERALIAALAQVFDADGLRV